MPSARIPDETSAVRLKAPEVDDVRESEREVDEEDLYEHRRAAEDEDVEP